MTLSVLGLALLDSLNPSAIVVSLLIVVARFDDRRRMAASLLAYAAGITVAMVGVGVALMLGLRVLIDQVLRDVPERALDVAQLVVGVIILLIGALTPAKPKRARRPLDLDRGAGRLFVLGLGVTVVELSSAAAVPGGRRDPHERRSPAGAVGRVAGRLQRRRGPARRAHPADRAGHGLP